MKFKIALLTTFVLMLTAFAVFAGESYDDRGNPNDPTVNERANACYDGGTLEGKCSTTDIDKDGTVEEWEIEWHFTCGWYLIRYESSLISESSLPAGCDSTPDISVIEPTPEPCETDLVICPA